jgi:hypothetical protein
LGRGGTLQGRLRASPSGLAPNFHCRRPANKRFQSLLWRSSSLDRDDLLIGIALVLQLRLPIAHLRPAVTPLGGSITPLRFLLAPLRLRILGEVSITLGGGTIAHGGILIAASGFLIVPSRLLIGVLSSTHRASQPPTSGQRNQ